MHKTDTPQGLTPSTSTIALTGATGFIGKKIRNQLIAAGFKVKCLTRTKSTNSPNSWEEHLTDLKSTDSISTAIKGTHAIIYIAGTVRGASPSDFKAANVEGVRNITSVLAKTQPTTPILLISSLAADFPHLSNYAKSKAEGEQALIKSGHSKWSIFRPPAVYGDGDHELRNVFKLMRLGIVTAIAPLEQKLPFIEVTDLANAAVSWALNTERCEQKIYAIDDGKKGGYNSLSSESGNERFMQQQKEDQSRILKEQDVVLDEMDEGLMRIGGMAESIATELDDQNKSLT